MITSSLKLPGSHAKTSYLRNLAKKTGWPGNSEVRGISKRELGFSRSQRSEKRTIEKADGGRAVSSVNSSLDRMASLPFSYDTFTEFVKGEDIEPPLRLGV